MDFWGMLTQPLLTTFVVTPGRQHPPKWLAGQYRFIYVKMENIWGINEEIVTTRDSVRVSDRERPIIDALAHPEYCGGITEIAKGMWIVREKLDLKKLMGYVAKYKNNVVVKRLEYLLEILKMGGEEISLILKKYIHDRYDIFDPMLRYENLARNEWHLIDNVHPEHIRNVI